MALTPRTLVNVMIVLQTGSDCCINAIQKWVVINSGTATKKKTQAQRLRNWKNTFCSWEEKPTQTQNKISSNKPHSLPSINRVSSGRIFWPQEEAWNEIRCFSFIWMCGLLRHPIRKAFQISFNDFNWLSPILPWQPHWVYLYTTSCYYLKSLVA